MDGAAVNGQGRGRRRNGDAGELLGGNDMDGA